MRDVIVMAVIPICMIAISIVGVFVFALGTTRGESQIFHECKSFQATVIRGEKFRCELIKEK